MFNEQPDKNAAASGRKDFKLWFVPAGDEAPFRASFQVLNAENELVTQFETDENGCFSVMLPPGEYTIVPDSSAPIWRARHQKKTVTVPEGGFAGIILKFDTGMR